MHVIPSYKKQIIEQTENGSGVVNEYTIYNNDEKLYYM